MKKGILLLCLLFAGIATTFAQTDTIRFAPTKITYQAVGDIYIFASSDTVKFTLAKKGEKSIVCTVIKEKSSFQKHLERAEEYKIYDIQGKIATFKAVDIASLELNNCTNIDTLTVQVNSYAAVVKGHISVNNCRNLKKINVITSAYLVSDFTIRNSGDLAILEISHCGLDIDDESCHNLQKLDCSEGIIDALNFKSCDSLKELICYYTYFPNDSLDLSGCTKLEKLDCSAFVEGKRMENRPYNPVWTLYTHYTLKYLNVRGCINLETLNCNNQAIEYLDVSSCSNLKNLYCQGAFALSELNEVRCDGRLRSLKVTGCDSLRYISCAYQPLDSLDASNLIGLRTLDIPRGGGSEYGLKKLNVSGCTNLERLDCSAFYACYSFYSSSYYFGRLQYLDASGCTNLESLNLSDISRLNTFQHLDVSGCAKLKNLDASSCKLTFLDVSGCDSLRSLFCYGNQLSTLNASGCSALTKMEAQNNALPLSECYTLPQCNDRKLTPQNIYVNCTVDRGLDLSGEMSFNGYATTCSVKLNNAVATAGQDYTINDSMVSFLTGGSFEIMLRNTAVKGAEVYYHVTVPYKVKTPRIKSSQDTLAPGSKVSIICATEDVQIYYTLDGTDPSETSLRYYYPIKLNESTTIKAIAVKYGWTNSDIATASFIVKDPNDDNNDPLAITPLQPQIALNAYPNPCGDILYIETSQNNKDGEIHAFRILDLQGREQICAPGSVRQIDMSRMPVGVYLLEAIGKNGAVCRHKIIKR